MFGWKGGVGKVLMVHFTHIYDKSYYLNKFGLLLNISMFLYAPYVMLIFSTR